MRKLTKKELQSRKKPWITKGIRKSIETKNRLFKSAINVNKNDINSNKKSFSPYFKKYRNLLTRVKELSKKLYYQKSVNNCTGNSKKLWSVINNIVTYKTPKSSCIAHIEDVNGTVVSDPELISNEFNDTFATIADSLLEKIEIMR